MSESKHTPGPWHCQNTPFENGKPYFTFTGGKGCYGDDGSGFGFTGIISEADACVIVAAPDTLAALRTAVRHIEHMAPWISKQNAGYSFESLGEDMPGIRAAKAEGRS